MGCAQSRIENEESVVRCKDRKNLMKDAVVTRNAFAAGHSGYAISLKNTGAALSDYGHGEAEEPLEEQPRGIPPLDSTPQPPPPPPMMDNLPPPPPLPNFSPSPAAPIKRALSMPEMPIKSRKEKDSRGHNREDMTASTSENNNVTHHPPPMPEAKHMAWDYFFMVDNNMPGPSLDLDNNDNETEGRNAEPFANNVGGVGFNSHGGADSEIEPKTPERPEKVAVEDDVKGKQQVQMEHSKTAPADFMRMVKTVSSVNLMLVLNEIDDHFLKCSESAQEVSKMLEATRLHYHSNFADNRGHIDHSARVMRVITWNSSFRGMTNIEDRKDEFDSEEHESHATVLDKLLAWEKKLYDEVKQGELMKLEYKRKSMDSTVSEVNRLRDEQLYPKLVMLVDGMANMWASMCIHHDRQLKVVEKLKSLDVALSSKETTKQHHDWTIQLHNVVQEWHSQFNKLVTNQKQYILALNNCFLTRLPNPFAAVIKTIIIHQDEEMKLKEKCEETRKEFLRKSQAFEEWYHKYKQRRSALDEIDAGEDANAKDPVSERQLVVESLKKRLEEEAEAHKKHCIQVREKSIGSLKIRLPEIFRALSDYSHACSEAYEKLRSVTQSQKTNGAPS
ncbi:hypothetical protein GOBAR_DD11961 [Gossypium barbadense]|nr:hypothetical protein GOBAR_DD11961 [Gossypium barbadense]